MTPAKTDEVPSLAARPAATARKKAALRPRALSADALEQLGASTTAEWLMTSSTPRAAVMRIGLLLGDSLGAPTLPASPRSVH